MSKRVTARIKAREAQQAQIKQPEVVVVGDSHSSGVNFDMPAPKPKAKPKKTK